MEKFVLKIKDENIDLEDYLKSLPFVSSFKHTKGDIFSFDIEEDFHDEALDIFELMESDFYSIIKGFYYTSLFDETQINFLVSILDNTRIDNVASSNISGWRNVFILEFS